MASTMFPFVIGDSSTIRWFPDIEDMLPTTASPEPGMLMPFMVRFEEDNINISDVTVTSSPEHAQRQMPDPNMPLIRFVCEVVVSFPIAVLGIIGNLLAFIVLCNHKQKLTTTVLLQALAVTDTLVLISSILLRSMRYVGLDGYNAIFNYVFLGLYPCVYFFRLADTWLTVLLTVDRFIAVCYPLHAQRLCTLKRTYIHIAVLLASTLIFSIPRFFEFQTLHPGHFQATGLVVTKPYVIGYQIIMFFLAMYLIPMTLLVVLNIGLLKKLKQLAKFRAHAHNDCPGSVASNGRPVAANKVNNSVTSIVVTVVIIFITCNCSAMVTHVLYSLQRSFLSLAHLEKSRRYLANVTNVMVTINCAVNFIIYCLCSHSFRRVFLATFDCKRIQESSKGPVTSYAMTSQGDETRSYGNEAMGESIAACNIQERPAC